MTDRKRYAIMQALDDLRYGDVDFSIGTLFIAGERNMLIIVNHDEKIRDLGYCERCGSALIDDRCVKCEGGVE